MDLKIFQKGFSEAEFNKFCKENIIYKYHIIDDGSVYVMYKDLNNIGKDSVEIIEDLDRVVKQSQVEILAYELDRMQLDSELESLKTKINEFHTNQGEYKDLEKDIKGKELQLKMNTETIEDRRAKINNANIKLSNIIDTKKELKTE